jgi:hypothetical protein
MKYLVFLLIIISLPISAQVADNNSSKVWVIANHIKDNAKADYEKWMTDIFLKPMAATKDPILMKQNASTRWLNPAKQNTDKTWTYVFLMDPVIPKANYDIESYLKQTYGEAQGKAYMAQYQGFIASEPQIHVLKNDRIETVQSEEETIKKVIIDEMDAYITSNVEAWANAQMQTPYHSTLHKFVNVSSAVGWDKKYEDAKKNFGTPNDIAYKKSYDKVNRTDWNIQIRGNVAWARWKDTWDMVNGSVLPMYNLKILEKQNNQWRISHAGVYSAPEETFNQAKEEEAIKKVILNEGIAFSQGNIDAFMDTYADVPYLIWTVTNGGEPGDVLTYRGYKALKEWAMNLPWFKNYKPDSPPSPNANVWEKDNWNIEIKGNIAIVNFDEHWLYGKEKSKLNVTVIKILERINGKWKFINTSALGDFKDAVPPIRSKY